MTSAVEFLLNAMFFSVPVVLCLVLYSLVMLCINWKTEHRKRHAKRFGIFLAVLPLIAVAIYVTTWFVMVPLLVDELTMQREAAKAERFSETTRISIGDPAPEFTLKTLSGENFVAPQRNKVVVVTFFATWCGPCLVELPHIQRIWESNRNDNRVQMIVISREETEQEVTEFLNSNGFTFPAAADTKREIFSKFATESIPRTFIIGPDGTVAYATIGFTDGDESELSKKLNTLRDSLPNNK